jgi:outer membrane protein TolC
MQQRSAWPSMSLLAVVLCRIAPTPCVAQSPPTTQPAENAAARPGARPSLPLPPSTVSPAIERFLKQSGRDLPASAPSRSVSTTSRRVEQPPPAPLPAGGSVATDLPRALPNPAATTRGVNPAAGVNPLATDLRLKPAPLLTTDMRFPINLATALRLSDARPLVVAAAQASVWVAEADLTRARVLWVPSFLFGADYIRHDGGGPDFNKGVMTAPSVNFFYAGPTLYQYVNVTDVIYQPLVARQVLNARHWDVQTAKNDVLMQTTDAYFRVHQARGTYVGALYTVERGRDLVDRIAQLSRELVPRVEVDRARNMLADLEQRAAQAREDWRVRSADLTQVLRLDPRAVVEPMEHDHAQVTLIDPARPLDDLTPIALTNRPELASRRALVQAAEAGIRQEKARPLLPVVMLNGFQSAGMYLQGGIFALGPNSSLNQWTGRDDVSIQLMWQLENFGIGNLARIKAQRGRESRAIIDLRKTQDTVAGGGGGGTRRPPPPVGHGPRDPGRPRLAYGHHHLQRAPRGSRTNQAFWERPGPDLPPPGGGLFAGTNERLFQRILRDGLGIQPGAVRAIPCARLPRPRGRVAAHTRRTDGGRHRPAAVFAPSWHRTAASGPVTARLLGRTAGCAFRNRPGLVPGVNPMIGTRQ